MSYEAEKVTCPKCGAVPGEPCMKLRRPEWHVIPRGYPAGMIGGRLAERYRLTQSHPQRVHAGAEYWNDGWCSSRDDYLDALAQARRKTT